jgi:acyl-CoA synthetase (NDP forming)
MAKTVSGADPLLSPYMQLLFDKDFRGKPILDPEATKYRTGNADREEKAMNALLYIARQQIPFFKNGDDMIRAYNEEPDYYKRNKDLKQALLNNVIKIQEFNTPEAKAELEKEIQFKLDEMDRLSVAYKNVASLMETNIAGIKDRKISKKNEEDQIRTQYVRAQNKVAELLERQAEIKQELLEPRELLLKLQKTKKVK